MGGASSMSGVNSRLIGTPDALSSNVAERWRQVPLKGPTAEQTEHENLDESRNRESVSGPNQSCAIECGLSLNISGR